ncbi:Na(+)/H(+) antiporter subunit B [Candidatus Palauibacter soopunensis]|uniref:Na(+)/H(+) antiporter subunit B n=1 Tax=Candidatus Palauibacter soopunensis TaxID=3056739 RepID=UPI00238F0006|nr:Na(+)/H(+) antiporter subunit B [Candidatus Palauibacter soopunensis]MDE2879177.1 Na(+)/H(+) antiporter subunit B [Candidatus Palauibacter soopunensis]
MTDHTILRVVSKLLLPYVLLFALYVQFHGDYGPGGGFQAGVIFAAGFVLYGLIFGLTAVRRVAPARMIELVIATGVLVYAGTGVVTMLMGGNFLDYDALNPAYAADGQHYGILVVELGVGMTVAAVMIAVYSTFAGRGRA